MKLEDNGVTAELVAGYFPDPDSVRFSKDGVAVEVPLEMIQLVWHAWA